MGRRVGEIGLNPGRMTRGVTCSTRRLGSEAEFLSGLDRPMGSTQFGEVRESVSERAHPGLKPINPGFRPIPGSVSSRLLGFGAPYPFRASISPISRDRCGSDEAGSCTSTYKAIEPRARTRFQLGSGQWSIESSPLVGSTTPERGKLVRAGTRLGEHVGRDRELARSIFFFENIRPTVIWGGEGRA